MTHQFLRAVTFSAVFAALAGQPAAAGDWGDEFPITQDPVFQRPSYITTAPDDTVYVLWPDWSDWEDTKITLTKSTDRGGSWTSPAILFDGKAYDNMDIVADADGVHLLLVEFTEDKENEYKFLFYAKSTDQGASFSTPLRIGERTNIESIRFFTAPGKIYVYAKDYDFELEEAYDYLYVSDDGGQTWTEKPLLPSIGVFNPAFTVDGGELHLVFGGFFGGTAIMHSKSNDDGDSWSFPVDVSSGAGSHSQLPQIAVDGGAIHVTWEDDRGAYFNIMYSRSTDGGQNWNADAQLNVTEYGARAQLLADETGLHVVWCQYHGASGWPSSWGSYDYGIIWYRHSDDSGLSWSDELRVSQNESIPPGRLPDEGTNEVKLAEYGDGFCAMWQDKRDGNVDLYMRNYGDACDACDMNCDGSVDAFDIEPFLDLLFGPNPQPCDTCTDDANGDGNVDAFDIEPFLECLFP